MRAPTKCDVDAKRILVVDDNVAGATALVLGLSLFGFNVRPAHDGLMALEVAAAFRPHIVLLDIALPMFDGWEVARRLLTMSVFRRPRVIAYSGLADPVHRARSEEVGIECHLRKPTPLAEVRRVIEQLDSN